MFRVTNTKNLLGVTIHGDYDDLNDLYDAIYHNSTYYYEKQAGYYDRIRNDRPDLKMQMTHEIEIQEARHNCVLGLCYDIRHAYMGDSPLSFLWHMRFSARNPSIKTQGDTWIKKRKSFLIKLFQLMIRQSRSSIPYI